MYLAGSLQTENEDLLDVILTVNACNYHDDRNYKKKVRRAMLTGNFKPSTHNVLQVEAINATSISAISNLKNYEREINRWNLAAVFYID